LHIHSKIRSRFRITFFIAWLLVFSIILYACSFEDRVSSSDDEAQHINKLLICPICPSETIDQAQVQLAVQMRDIVTRKLQAGESEEQILQFFVDRYGESVLAAPPKSGFSLLVWVVPPVGLLGAILLLYFLMKNMQRLGGREDMSQNIKTSKMLKNQINPYLRRVDQEIDLLGVENPETFHAADRE